MSTERIDPKAENRARKRAAAVLAGMAVLAVVFALLMVTFLRSNSQHTQTALTVPLASSTAAPSSTPATPAPTSAASTTGASSGPTTIADCHSTAPCSLSGDGGVLAAVNAYRASHQQSALTGSVSTAATKCAMQNGDGASCTSNYFWEPMSALDGPALVTKIAGKATGKAWLLDPSTKTIAIGWANLSGSGSGSYACAVIADPHGS